ncbi:hypothetical protein [Pseudomonas aeruginosa]|uniref:hypothetical protein n=1 Tax=Pseudomonas aeruginosa TaxID=287 RepID=UPI000C2C884A|nr:hypothetical protein [Pseudomonas aeruginosa]AUA83931.1 hypothetical protein CWI22_16570 [Pseudomonas aeruginosa]AUA85217.1 hypothetical protein CWI22_23440 [Pseudomonas aeruginosa]AUA90022.1 hypothetical protein CWI23_16615 [Pseudomonas aeruginosa]AUA91308.1 hypothetical protein CWI23_23485 [Pseudomonas aeruginosa]
MSKHTPGPWGQDKWGSLQTEGGQDVLLRGITTISAGSDERIAEAEANTRLIAAAPELLDALVNLLPLISPLKAESQQVADASAAIAKATA